MKEIVLLGSTGSIGTQTLNVVLAHNIKVKALSAYSNTTLLEQQARRFHPEYVCLGNKELYGDIKQRLSDTGIKVEAGAESLCLAAALPCDIVVNAIVGMAGLSPTVSAINAGNNIGLANKETLVAGGELVMKLAKEKGVKILPIDSEHSAIFQSLMGNKDNHISKIILTASGGPFYGKDKGKLEHVTVEQALNHPNWKMGAKITIDSATMMNKGLELIEAVRLFGVKPEQVEIVIHRQSILHSAVEYDDGAVIGQLGTPDMQIPIQMALTYPKRLPCPAKKLSLTDIGTLTFEKPDYDTFSCLGLAKRAVITGGNLPCVMNCANEAAVKIFLEGRIKFTQIWELVEKAMDNIPFYEQTDLNGLYETERQAEEYIYSLC